MTKAGISKYERVRKLLNRANMVRWSNPYAAPVMATPPTVTFTNASDGALGAAVLMTSGVTNSVLTSAALNQVAWYGGIPKGNGKYVHMPVASVSPAVGGNLAGYANTAITADMNAWNYGEVILTDALTVEFGIFANSSMRVMLQVDDQYVDKVGWVGAQAGGADNFLKLVFATRKMRKIRLMHAIRAGAASGSMLFQIRLTALAKFRSPVVSNLTKLLWFGDSNGEGLLHAYETPNAPNGFITGELLGFDDTRLCSVGQTGYTVDNGGLRKKLRDQLPMHLDPAGSLYQGVPDAIMFSHGYNDYPTAPATITAEVAYDLALARSYANCPILVNGAMPGNKGPDAQLLAVENAISAGVTQYVASSGDKLCKFLPFLTDTVVPIEGTGYVGATNASGNSDYAVDTDHIHLAVYGHELAAYQQAHRARVALSSMLN